MGWKFAFFSLHRKILGPAILPIWTQQQLPVQRHARLRRNARIRRWPGPSARSSICGWTPAVTGRGSVRRRATSQLLQSSASLRPAAAPTAVHTWTGLRATPAGQPIQRRPAAALSSSPATLISSSPSSILMIPHYLNLSTFTPVFCVVWGLLLSYFPSCVIIQPRKGMLKKRIFSCWIWWTDGLPFHVIAFALHCVIKWGLFSSSYYVIIESAWPMRVSRVTASIEQFFFPCSTLFPWSILFPCSILIRE